MLKQNGFTEENNQELAKMVAFLKAMAHQRKSSSTVVLCYCSLSIQNKLEQITLCLLQTVILCQDQGSTAAPPPTAIH